MFSAKCAAGTGAVSASRTVGVKRNVNWVQDSHMGSMSNGERKSGGDNPAPELGKGTYEEDSGY